MKQQGRGKARLVKLFDGGEVEDDATTDALVDQNAVLNTAWEGHWQRQREAKKLEADALVDAAKKGDAEKVQELLDAGADVNHTKEGVKIKGRTALYWAAREGHLEIVKALIDVSGVEVDKEESTYGFTPLIFAALRGHLNIVKALVKTNANVNKASNFGTPLKVATGWNHKSVAEYLKSVGASEGGKRTLKGKKKKQKKSQRQQRGGKNNKQNKSQKQQRGGKKNKQNKSQKRN